MCTYYTHKLYHTQSLYIYTYTTHTLYTFTDTTCTLCIFTHHILFVYTHHTHTTHLYTPYTIYLHIHIHVPYVFYISYTYTLLKNTLYTCTHTHTCKESPIENIALCKPDTETCQKVHELKALYGQPTRDVHAGTV